MASLCKELPLPPHYDPAQVGLVWRVPYQQRAAEARQWAQQFALQPAANDARKVALLCVDLQNTFCLPDFELYVAGRSGSGALDDNRRLVEFIYRHLARLTQISVTLDSHRAMQIFHAIFLVNEEGENPPPFTLISADEVYQRRWKFNVAIGESLGITPEEGQLYLQHYVNQLKKQGKYDLTIWPYHAMVGGIGHALVSSVEEAIFFHSIARNSQPDFEIKGFNPFAEHYSAIGPEVLDGPDGKPLGSKSEKFLRQVLASDAVIIAGQAKSHCVAWTIDDLLRQCAALDSNLIRKIYLLDDCSSAVVIPGVVDYTAQAEAACSRFAEAGVHIVRSTDPLESWPGILF